MASTPHPLALADLRGFHDSKHLSDITICFSGRKVRAHKVVLCLASDYFQMTFSGRFVVQPDIRTRLKHRLIRACKESKSNEIELKEDDPDALAGMLRHIYGLDPFEAVADPGIYFDFRLYDVAGKYLLPNLQEKATASAKKKLERKWNDTSFSDYVYSIYQQTAAHGGELRQIAKDICRKHLPELMAKKEFKKVLLDTPELSLAIMQVVAREDVTYRSG